MKPVISLVFLILLATSAFGADDKTELAQLSKAYDAALKARDRAVLDKLFDDEGVFILSDGRQFSKKDYIKRLTREQVVLEMAESKIESIRVVGKTAFESGVWTSKGTVDGQPRVTRERYLVVWIKAEAGWRIASEQVTEIKDEK